MSVQTEEKKEEVIRLLEYTLDELTVAMNCVMKAGRVSEGQDVLGTVDDTFEGWVDKASACMSAANVHLGRAKSARQSITPKPEEERHG